MTIKIFHLALITFFTLVTVAPLSSASPATDSSQASTGYYRTIEWRSEQETARGLFLFRSEPAGLMRRVLIEDPDGRRLVLTKVLLPREGVDHEVLLDERTGWRIELTKRFPFKAPTLRDYLRMSLQDDPPGLGEDLPFTLSTNTGFSFSASVVVAEQPALEHQRFAQSLLADEASREGLELPAELADSVRFLDRAFETEASDSRGIIEILAAVLGRGGGVGVAADWRQLDGAPVPGMTVGDGELVAFATEFGSVDPAAPLPGGDLEDAVEIDSP